MSSTSAERAQRVMGRVSTQQHWPGLLRGIGGLIAAFRDFDDVSNTYATCTVENGMRGSVDCKETDQQ